MSHVSQSIISCRTRRAKRDGVIKKKDTTYVVLNGQMNDKHLPKLALGHDAECAVYMVVVRVLTI